MKIILSRKGFDSAAGGQPSPILPDGTLLSLPIPSLTQKIMYSDLYYKTNSYYNIITELRPNSNFNEYSTCHFDPDIVHDAYPRIDGWKGLFGQTGSALSHLKNNNVEIGDIFLFFGWFKETVSTPNGLKYKINAPDLHMIYGFLEIGDIHMDNDIPEWMKYHPHNYYVKEGDHYSYEILDENNCIFEASDNLCFNKEIPGYGSFKYNEGLVLTKKGETRSRWDLPEFFKDVNITYHTKNSFKENYFLSAGRGQEFIIDDN